MKNVSLIAAGLLLACLALAGPAAAGFDCSPRLQVAATFFKLDLKDGQKTQIARILKAERPSIKAEIARLKSARVKLFTALATDNPDQQGLKAAYAELTAAGESALQLAAKVLPRLRAVLTPEQRAIFNKQRVKIARAAACRREAKGNLLDKWIERHAK